MARFLVTLVIAIIGGLLFQLIHIPLPWMLGPLTSTTVWSNIFKQQIWWPLELRKAAFVVLGYTIGTSFSPEIAVQILRQIPAMMITAVATISVSLLIGYLTSRGTGMSLSSGILGSVPGGMNQMVLLCDEIKGADVSAVIFLQTARQLSVVFVVPFLVKQGIEGSTIPENLGVASSAGWTLTAVDPVSILLYLLVILAAAWITARLGVPVPFLIGPVLGVVLLNMLGGKGPEAPRLLVLSAQLSMGAFMGQQIKPGGMTNWKKVLPYALAGSLALILFSLLMGELLSVLLPTKLANAFLSTAPGGIAEMGVTALQVHGDLPLVSAFQMFRVFIILMIVPPVLKRWLGGIKQEKQVVQDKTFFSD